MLTFNMCEICQVSSISYKKFACIKICNNCRPFIRKKNIWYQNVQASSISYENVQLNKKYGIFKRYMLAALVIKSLLV
jgi:hypothetical protein